MAGEDTAKDKAMKKKPILASPEDERQKIRIKRLARLVSNETGEGPFEEGDLVHVEPFGYGVMKWLGNMEKNDKLVAGIEFVSIFSCVLP